MTKASVPSPTAIPREAGVAGGPVGQAVDNPSVADQCCGPEPLGELRPLVPSSAAVRATPPKLGNLDLRIYAPIPEVVIVRVSGVVDSRTAPVLAKRVNKQLTRASHVVIDLGQVTVLGPLGLAVLRRLQSQATANGTQIHLATAQRADVHRALHGAGLDQLFSLHTTVEAVIADIRAQRHEQTRPGGPQGNKARRVTVGRQETRLHRRSLP